VGWPNDEVNRVAASQLAMWETVIGNSGSTFCSPLPRIGRRLAIPLQPALCNAANFFQWMIHERLKQ
jgi:hypothetical protein